MGAAKTVRIRRARVDEGIRAEARESAREMFWVSLPFVWFSLLMAGCLAHALYPLSLDEVALLVCAGAVSSFVPAVLEYRKVLKRAKGVM